MKTLSCRDVGVDCDFVAQGQTEQEVMEKFLAPFGRYAYAIMRIIVGLLFVAHGGQKLFGWFGGQPVPLGSLFGVAGIIEIVLGGMSPLGSSPGMRLSSPAARWQWPISSVIFQKVSGLLRTKASWRCSSASRFCIWPLKALESGVSTQCGPTPLSRFPSRKFPRVACSREEIRSFRPSA